MAGQKEHETERRVRDLLLPRLIKREVCASARTIASRVIRELVSFSRNQYGFDLTVCLIRSLQATHCVTIEDDHPIIVLDLQWFSRVSKIYFLSQASRKNQIEQSTDAALLLMLAERLMCAGFSREAATLGKIALDTVFGKEGMWGLASTETVSTKMITPWLAFCFFHELGHHMLRIGHASMEKSMFDAVIDATFSWNQDKTNVARTILASKGIGNAGLSVDIQIGLVKEVQATVRVGEGYSSEIYCDLFALLSSLQFLDGRENADSTFIAASAQASFSNMMQSFLALNALNCAEDEFLRHRAFLQAYHFTSKKAFEEAGRIVWADEPYARSLVLAWIIRFMAREAFVKFGMHVYPLPQLSSQMTRWEQELFKVTLGVSRRVSTRNILLLRKLLSDDVLSARSWALDDSALFRFCREFFDAADREAGTSMDIIHSVAQRQRF